MNLEHFTPTTLAAMFVDLRAAMGDVYAVLTANIGEAEAEKLIAATELAERPAGHVPAELPNSPPQDSTPGPAGCLRDIADAAETGDVLSPDQIALLRDIAEDIE